jgi:(1->4)-alpha-D-glucan 1-alpha-D-glucosylmutase
MNPGVGESIFDFLEDVLLLRRPSGLSEEERTERLEFVMRLQQITGPVMAKGLEDTAFYVYNRLISLNEVGGAPDRFGTPVEEFHKHNLRRQKFWPRAMISTSTHDSKRSEDVRARINVLSEVPEEWRKQIAAWRRLNRRECSRIDGGRAPDANEEYLLYQTLVGTWPVEGRRAPDYLEYVERIKAYMLKALREAKVTTSWINPRILHEQAVEAFVESILKRNGENGFLDSFEAFHKKIAYCGMCNSLSQTLLKITSPGVPDFYQGTEIWNFSLVDPDNRRPVDYGERKSMLYDLRQLEKEVSRREVGRRLKDGWQDGKIKMYVAHVALNFRKELQPVVNRMRYVALETAGERSGNVVAFARRARGFVFVVAVPRLLMGLLDDGERPSVREGVWDGSFLRLPAFSASAYENLFTGEAVQKIRGPEGDALRLSELFGDFPVALLRGLGPVEEG